MTPAALRAAALAALTPALGETAAYQALAALDVHGLTVAAREAHAAVGDVPLRCRLGDELIAGEGQ